MLADFFIGERDDNPAVQYRRQQVIRRALDLIPEARTPLTTEEHEVAIAKIVKRFQEAKMSVRAKFHCNFKDSNVIHLSPVYSGSDENKSFFAATPGGQITLNVLNPAAAEQFVQGKEYYVDFTPAV